MEPRKQAIIDALRAFIRQRPGLEFGNYGDVTAYRAECRSIARDKREAETLLQAVSWRDGITWKDIVKASESAYSGRLSIDMGDDWQIAVSSPNRQRIESKTVGFATEQDARDRIALWRASGSPDAERAAVLPPTSRVSIGYCTGQYFPTEYRRAVCAVLASALWEYTRGKAMPAPSFTVECTDDDGKRTRATSKVFSTRADADQYAGTVAAPRHAHSSPVYGPKNVSAGDWLRAHFRNEFGRSIASRWFR
jgi:hypothetical protein